MSTQSVIHNTRDSLSDKVDELYMLLGHKLIMNKRFGVGGKINKNNYFKVKWLERLMCEDNCLLGGLENKIKEKLNLLLINCK